MEGYVQEGFYAGEGFAEAPGVFCARVVGQDFGGFVGYGIKAKLSGKVDCTGGKCFLGYDYAVFYAEDVAGAVHCFVGGKACVVKEDVAFFYGVILAHEIFYSVYFVVVFAAVVSAYKVAAGFFFVHKGYCSFKPVADNMGNCGLVDFCPRNDYRVFLRQGCKVLVDEAFCGADHVDVYGDAEDCGEKKERS